MRENPGPTGGRGGEEKKMREHWVILIEQIYAPIPHKYLSTGGLVVKALSSGQYSPGSIPGRSGSKE